MGARFIVSSAVFTTVFSERAELLAILCGGECGIGRAPGRIRNIPLEGSRTGRLRWSRDWPHGCLLVGETRAPTISSGLAFQGIAAESVRFSTQLSAVASPHRIALIK